MLSIGPARGPLSFIYAFNRFDIISPMNQKAKNILRPLYAYGFIEALIFWYAIEKLLFTATGVTPEQIIIIGLVAQSSQVLIEVPSSIVADRWSRRKTLILASLFMLLSIVIILVWQNLIAYMIMAFTWACYFAFRSGTTNAYMYDLLKKKGSRHNIERPHHVIRPMYYRRY